MQHACSTLSTLTPPSSASQAFKRSDIARRYASGHLFHKLIHCAVHDYQEAIIAALRRSYAAMALWSNPCLTLHVKVCV